MQTTVQYRNDFRDDMSKITEHYFHCGDIQIPTERDRLVLKWLQKWQNPTFFLGIFNLKLKKTIQYWNDFKDDRHQHLLWGHSKSNWKRQFSIEKIYKITKLYILCGDIQILTEKDGLVLKWLQGWQNPILFLGTFKFQLTEPYLTSFVGTFKVQLKKTVQYRNDFKDDRILHPLQEHSISNWKRLFSIAMISKMTEHYILWGEIQIPTKKDSLVLKWFQKWQYLTFFVGTFKFRLTEPRIFYWDIQILTEKKNSSVSKWFQRWPNLTFIVGTFKFQMRNAVQYRDDFKDQWTLHPLWEHSNPNWRRQFSIEMIIKMTEPYIYCRDIQIPTDWTLHPFLGDSNFNWKRQLII